MVVAHLRRYIINLYFVFVVFNRTAFHLRQSAALTNFIVVLRDMTVELEVFVSMLNTHIMLYIIIVKCLSDLVRTVSNIHVYMCKNSQFICSTSTTMLRSTNFIEKHGSNF